MARGRVRVLSLVALVAAIAASAHAASPPKVVVIGFDGADARLVEQWMNEGKLPNLAKLRDEGTFAPLQPTNPPQTPVSWSSFATGTQPGKTEIFDFLKRNPADYLPDFAMNSESRKPFLYGDKNPIVLGAGVGLVAFLAALGVLSAFRAAWASRVLVSCLIAAAAGLPVGFLARTYLPIEVPTAINHRKGSTMWELASRAGKKVQVIRVPATFPAEDVGDGHMISGLGVPDMRGMVGKPSFYTSDPTFQAKDGNQFSLELIRLPSRRGKIETRIIGPYNKPFYDYVVDRRVAAAPSEENRGDLRRKFRQELDDEGIDRRIDLPLTFEAEDDAVTVSVSGRAQTLKVGDWSAWFTLDFPVNWVVDRAAPLRGIARFKLLRLQPELEMYLSPINFHPDCHPVAFSWPPDYSETIAKRFGLYKTIGWPEDTWSLPSGVGDEDLFLEDTAFTVAKDEEIMKGLLGDGTDDLYIQIFYFTDRVGHLFWRFIDPGHPLHAEPLAPGAAPGSKAGKYAPEVLKSYQKMDDLVGTARALAGPDATFIVCSDHGFSSFRRGVNINTWLVRNGLMALKGQSDDPATLEKLFDTRDLFQNVDWSRTKAYALGLGSIYINLVGREKNGIVMPGPEYDEVRRKIKEGLEALVDPAGGAKPIHRVWTREEMYTGFDTDLIPDLRAGNSLDYRVSWQTSLGGVPPEILDDNLSPWSGDHCSNDPDLVRGIFFCNRKITAAAPAMVDLAPTILKLLGIPPPAEMDGKPLL